MSPGTGSTSNENRPYHHAYASDIDVGGQTTRANDVLLDGVPLTSSYKSSYTPALDAVQEVTFQKNAIDSEYGYSAGGVIVLNDWGQISHILSDPAELTGHTAIWSGEMAFIRGHFLLGAGFGSFSDTGAVSLLPTT